MKLVWKSILAGMAGGFVGNGVLGAVFTCPPVKALLYDKQLQSQLFRDITPLRNIPVSVAGLVVLSGIHGWLFGPLREALPGKTWWMKGLFWGTVIWTMYWLFQEWFIYHTLLREPLILCALELSILLLGSAIEGLIIAFVLRRS
jgi:hypothetical protein